MPIIRRPILIALFFDVNTRNRNLFIVFMIHVSKWVSITTLAS